MEDDEKVKEEGIRNIFLWWKNVYIYWTKILLYNDSLAVCIDYEKIMLREEFGQGC